ncbi:XdhC/CoxI family protein [Dokdonella sp.]|uniref:XdhC family protein n=1 Tax=Dokdonella sp. TaxID=2291710 RepID=UPI001B14421A|nr:XdhC/CoxI family protein [Dokdonella sp.]MBO9661653.1 XdhC family protein [Dokdonella sp.]
MTHDPASAQVDATTPLGGLRAVVEGARALAARGEAGVLAVVVETTGSTYRKPGALILLDAHGVHVGALSGGCLEGELETAARAVLERGFATDLRFDTSGDEDRVFGSGTGCGGSTRVRLLPLPAAVSPLREALIEADELGAALELLLDNATDFIGGGEARIHGAAAEARRHRFDARGTAKNDDPGSPNEPIALVVRPAPRVLLLGAGPETPPLLRLTRMLGWRVELAEHRQRWARFAEGCGIDRLHGGGPDTLPTLLDGTHFDAALVMNHNYLLDARGLTRLAATTIGYVGLLGPAARRDDLLAEIGPDAAARLRPRLHAPVGLPLGGEGAEAIALAIVAQLQGALTRRDGA